MSKDDITSWNTEDKDGPIIGTSYTKCYNN